MRRTWILGAALAMTMTAHAQDGGVLGTWKTHGGATVSIYMCGSNTVCARLIGVRKDTPEKTDLKNPDATQRMKPLCGLQIGRDFHLRDSTHAEDGQLYDPFSGKTYSGSMENDGESLKLRGYIGIKLFGKTEVWTRVHGDVPACTQ